MSRGCGRCAARGGLQVLADESVHTAEDVQRLIAAEAVDGVHLKREMRNDCRGAPGRRGWPGTPVCSSKSG